MPFIKVVNVAQFRNGNQDYDPCDLQIIIIKIHIKMAIIMNH